MQEELSEHMLSNHEQRLNGHSKRIDRLEQDAAQTSIKIDNLCDNGVCGLLATTAIGVLAFGIENLLF